MPPRIIVLIIILVIYLNRSYAYFYDNIKYHSLQPQISPTLYIGSPESDMQSAITYIALGDSLSAGVGVDSPGKSFPYLFSPSLLVNRNMIELKVLAQPSATTQDVVDYQLEKAVQEDPDFVTILIGINDMHNFISPKTFKKNYQQIISTLKQKTKTRILILNIPFLGSQKVLLFPHNILVDLRTRYYNGIIEDLAKENDIELVDLYSKTKNEFQKNNELYSRDQFHPSLEGYKFWVKVMNEN